MADRAGDVDTEVIRRKEIQSCAVVRGVLPALRRTLPSGLAQELDIEIVHGRACVPLKNPTEQRGWNPPLASCPPQPLRCLLPLTRLIAVDCSLETAQS